MEINTNSPNSRDSSAAPVSLGNIQQRPGEFLCQIRLSQNKSLTEVAAELKITEKQLLALEADDYTALPEAPFIKGYYRAYAKFLNTDLATSIQSFDENYKNKTGMSAQHALKNSPIKTLGRLASSGRRRVGRWIKVALWLIILVLVLVSIYAGLNFWMNKKQPAKIFETSHSENNVEQVVSIGGTQQVTPSTGSDQLQLDFTHPTSVMIVDASGNTLAQGRQSSSIQLQGQAPFNIRIDDASAVKLKLNQETINLNGHTSSSGVVNLTLSP